jgi:hypothetical protein
MNHTRYITQTRRTGVLRILGGWTHNDLVRLDKTFENQINEQMMNDIVQGMNDKEEYNQMIKELVAVDEKYQVLRKSNAVVDFFATKKTRAELYKKVNSAKNKLSKKNPHMFRS